MKTYEKYIFSRIAAPMILITLGIVGIAWLSRSLKFIDLIVNKGLSTSAFLYLTTLTLPSLFWVIMPIALFIAVTYAYNKLSGDSEVIVLKSAGIDNFSILKPALYFSLLCVMISYSIAFYFLPASYREFKDMQNFVRNNYATLLLQEGVFSKPTAGLTVYTKEKDGNGIFDSIVIHDSRRQDKNVTVIAQKGILDNSKDGAVFVLKNGSHQEVNKNNGQISILYFDEYSLDLNPFKETLDISRKREPKERYLNELLFPSEEVSEKKYIEYISEFNNRLTWPLYSILLALIASLPFIKGSFNRSGNIGGIALSSIASLLIVILALSIKSMAQKHFHLSALMYVILTLEFTVLILFIKSNLKKHGIWRFS